jgi:hypothetical protein
MGEFSPLEDQQHSELLGEAPQSFESPMMRAWLGEQAKQQSLMPYDGVSRTHDHVDELQVGQSLGHHVMTNMLQSNISIALLLPPQQVSPSLSSFDWTIEYANPGVAPHVPEEAPFYEITYQTERRYQKIERRGVALRMTGNIMMTPEGLARLRSQLVVLAATMLLTIEYLTMRALVTAHDGPMYRRKMTLDRFSTREVEERISYDAARFASWNRNPDIEAANDMADVDKLLKQYVGGPYAVLYPAGRQAVLGGQVIDTGLSLTVKAMNAQRQVLQFQSLPSNMRMADGSLAFSVPDYSFGATQTKEQPLLRAVMIGEHCSMSGFECNDSAYRTGNALPGGGFATCMRDRWLYNVETDKYEKVEFAEAFRHSLFVPRNVNEEDPIDFFVGASSPLTPQSFDRHNRSAPSRVYYEGGPKKVNIFGQFDADVVSHKYHRAVGNTIAECVHNAIGDRLSSDLNDGIQLLRTLEASPLNSSLADALSAAMEDATRGTYGDLAPDIGRLYNVDQVGAVRQAADGSLNLSSARAQEIAGIINNEGPSGILLSVGGIRLLARLTEYGAVDNRARELATQARNLLDTAERIYGVLVDKFPEAMAVRHQLRPVNVLPTDGFATFFSNAFLNNGNLPVLMEYPGEGIVMTPFNWTRNTLATPVADRGPFLVGTVADPFTPAGDQAQAGGLFATRSFARKAHLRTTWGAQHFPMAEARRRQQIRSRGGAQQRGRGVGAGSDGEEDLFGITPTFRRNAGLGDVAAGETIIGARPLQDQPGIFDSETGDMRGLRTQVGDEQFNPLRSANAQNAWNEADAIDDPLVRVCTLVYLTAPCELMEHYDRMLRSNILVPHDILLIRPVVENDMYSVLVMKPGLDTGANIMAGALLDYGVDADHQTRKLTFSLRHTSVVKLPDHIAILPSRMARRYIAGGGCRLYSDPGQFDMQNGRPDIIAMVVPMGHTINRYEPIGGVNVDGVNGGSPGSYCFPDAAVYERVWHLSEGAIRTRQRADSYAGSAAQLPDYTWTMESLNWNRTKRQPAQGHRRGGSHPGCRDVWDANTAVFPDPPSGYDVA